MPNFSKDEIDLVIARLQSIPNHIRLSIGTANGVQQLTKDELITHVKSGSDIGKSVVQMQLNYLRSYAHAIQ